MSGTVILVAIALGALSLLRRDEGKELPPAVSKAPEFTGPEASLRGTIRAQHVVPVGVPMEGTIHAFFADAGQSVYEGQLLAQIQNTSLESERDAAAADLERARAEANKLDSALIAARLEASRARADASRARSEFESAEKTYQRQQMLYTKGATPRLVFEKAQKEFNLAKAGYLSLEEVARGADDRVAEMSRQADAARRELTQKTSDLEQAGQNLAAGQILSPVDGLVISRRSGQGMTVDPDMEDLFVIAVDLAMLEVVLEPEPPVLARVRAGQDALVQVAELPGQALPGKVREVKESSVIVEFTSPDPSIKPGLTAQVVLKLT